MRQGWLGWLFWLKASPPDRRMDMTITSKRTQTGVCPIPIETPHAVRCTQNGIWVGVPKTAYGPLPSVPKTAYGPLQGVPKTAYVLKEDIKRNPRNYSLRETRFAALTSLRSGASLIELTKGRIRFAHLETLSKPLITNLKTQSQKPRPLLTSLRSVRTVKTLDQLTKGLGFMRKTLIAYRLGFASPLGLSNPLTTLKGRIQKTLDHCSPRFARFAWYLRISFDYE